ncbi:MAG TPA: non-heme iron oxygenase ferredoxin subunit [Thiotrichales bacterium]|nr:non-heme iron oxygenase ferredoxin subunit [Thiotrichales bacterium]
MSDWLESGVTVEEIPEGTMRKVSLAGRRLLLVHAEGRVFACDEMCPHEEVSLALGCIQGRKIKCSLHGSRFDLESGRVLDEPADENLAVYPVRVEEGRILVQPD